MEPITITLETAKEAYEVAKKIQKVYNVSREMKTVAESEGLDQIAATSDLAGSASELKSSQIEKGDLKCNDIGKKSEFVDELDSEVHEAAHSAEPKAFVETPQGVVKFKSNPIQPNVFVDLLANDDELSVPSVEDNNDISKATSIESKNEQILSSDGEMVQSFDESLEDEDIEVSHGLDTTFFNEKFIQTEQTVDNYDFEKHRLIYQGDMKLGEPHDSNVLRKNLEIATGNNPENASAHHLVGNETPIASMKLEEFGIDRNDPTNGIFLPNKFESDCDGALHTGRHTQVYYNEIERRFLNVNSREEAIDALQSIKDDLYNGKLKLQY